MSLSVIIPTLNEEDYIEATLFHIKQQNPHEIIVADSKSEDRTIKIAEKYDAKIVTCKKKNAASGRNAGARVAKGDILVFFDADTIAYKNVLEQIEKDFKRKNVVGWTCKIFAFSFKWKEHIIYNLFNDIIKFLINTINKPHSGGMVMAIRKDIFEKVGGFDEGLTTMEDHDLAKRIGKFGKFKFSDKTCVFTSTRRLERWGGWKILKMYSKSYFKYLFNKKAIQHYTPVR